MPPADRYAWMWSEALDMLARAERLQRELYQPRRGGEAVSWEPPVDVLETEREVIVLAALPGVDPEQVEAAIEGGVLRIAGRRTLPPELRIATIHRLELPQGRFERHVPLPPGHYKASPPRMAAGCLIVHLAKIA
ncbi:MAG: Hsp20/alpha crystallin family protein [Hyphomonadaceae bacterium]